MVSRQLGEYEKLLPETNFTRFHDKYIINLGLRGEGHSRFGPAHRYGMFPSVSTRYRISAEPFMQRFKKNLDELSIRASYGQSGNAPRRDYSFYNVYGNFDWSYLGQAGVYPSNMELKNLTWETIIGQNLGFNLIMFKNRINLDVEVYKNRTKNLFLENSHFAVSFENCRLDIITIRQITVKVIPFAANQTFCPFGFPDFKIR